MLLTTHFMDEAQHLADRVAVIVGGTIVATGTPGTIGGRDVAAVRIRFALPAGVALVDLPVAAAPAAQEEPGYVELTTGDPTRALHELTGWALDRDVELRGLTVARPTLEDVYLELTEPPAEPPSATDPSAARGSADGDRGKPGRS